MSTESQDNERKESYVVEWILADGVFIVKSPLKEPGLTGPDIPRDHQLTALKDCLKDVATQGYKVLSTSSFSLTNSHSQGNSGSTDGFVVTVEKK